jgi:hypothetical protein
MQRKKEGGKEERSRGSENVEDELRRKEREIFM